MTKGTLGALLLLLMFFLQGVTQAQTASEKPQRLFFGQKSKINGYAITQVASLGGYFEQNFTVGLGVEQVLGHRWNRWVHTGIGFGVNNYELADQLLVIPVYAELRGYVMDYVVSPHYALGLGYGFATADPPSGITKAYGGVMLHPLLGITLGQGKKAQFHVEAGYRFQDIRYVKEYTWSPDVDEIKIQYRRLLIRLGVQFNFFSPD